MSYTLIIIGLYSRTILSIAQKNIKFNVIWRSDLCFEYSDIIETVHLQYCKQLFGVNTSASNAMNCVADYLCG